MRGGYNPKRGICAVPKEMRLRLNASSNLLSLHLRIIPRKNLKPAHRPGSTQVSFAFWQCWGFILHVQAARSRKAANVQVHVGRKKHSPSTLWSNSNLAPATVGEQYSLFTSLAA